MEYTPYIRDLLVSGKVLTSDPLGEVEQPAPDYDEHALYAADLDSTAGAFGGEVRSTAGRVDAQDGGEGDWGWDATSTATRDDGLTRGPSGTGRWRRNYTRTVNSAWFGSLVGANAGATITAAINAVNALGGGHVWVPRAAYTITGQGADRITLRGNVDLEFAPGCTISLGTPSLAGGPCYAIFADSTVYDIENVRVFGNGCVITGNKSVAINQSLISVNVQNVSDVCKKLCFYDFTLRDPYTDGLYIGGNVGAFHEHIEFHRITCTGARRNGCSVTHGTKAKFFDCHFDDNGDGQAPQAGVDIEVNNAVTGVYVALDLEFYRCTFNENTGTGLIAQAPWYGTNARVRVIDCDAHENGSIGIIAGIRDMQVRGCRARKNVSHGIYASEDAQVTDCRTEDNGGSGFVGIMSNEAAGFTNCVSRFNAGDGFLVNSYLQSTGVARLIGCHAFGNSGRGANLSGCTDAQIVGGSYTCNVNEGVRYSESTNCQVTGAIIEANGIANDSVADNVNLENASSFNALNTCTIRQSPRFHRGNAVVDATYTTTTKVKLASHASTSNDHYLGMYARIISGTQSGREGFITAYDGANQSATVYWTGTGTSAGALSSAPDATSVITIVGARLLAGVTVASATATTVVLPRDLASKRDDVYNGHTLRVISGTGAGQRATISDYDGSTGTLTVSTMSPVLDDTSVVEIIVKNRPRYGVRVNAPTCVGNHLALNDVYHGGASGQVSDAGTSTNSVSNRTT